MSHLQMLLTLEFGYCRSHHGKAAVRCGVTVEMSLQRAIASGSHYSEGRVSPLQTLLCYMLSTFREI